MTLKAELDFFTNQGIRTKIVPGSFSDFPDDVDQIVRIIQGLLIHPCTLKPFYNLNLSKKRIDRERSFKTVQEVLNQIYKNDKRSLLISREPKKRVVGICKHFAMFLCSVLREKGIPARARCGFATYFSEGWFEDHWICEYWNANQKRWIMVDAQVDDIQASNYGMNRNRINFLDLPKGVFFPAGVLWKLYRDGFVDGTVEGFSAANERGEWYIRGNMLRDFFALNEVEYLYSERDILMSKKRALTKSELLLLDKISEYTSKPDVNFDQIRDLYNKHKELVPR